MAQKRNSRRHRALIAVLIQSREQAELSQRDLSKAMKMPPNFVHLVETGERMLSSVELPSYAAALSVDIHELIKRWLALERSEELISKRQDARRNNRVPRPK